MDKFKINNFKNVYKIQELNLKIKIFNYWKINFQKAIFLII